MSRYFTVTKSLLLSLGVLIWCGQDVFAMDAPGEPSVAPVQRPPGGPRTDVSIYDPPQNQNISGVWWIQQFNPRILHMDGAGIPFTAEGLAKYQANMDGIRNGTILDEARRSCAPDGVPRILSSQFPFRIIQTPGQVTILYEINRVIRVVPLDQPLPPSDHLETFPFYSGHSVGRWEGDVLVIETVGFKDVTFIDATGVPHSNELTTTERIRKLNDDTLEIIAEISDPMTFTRPWTARFLYSAHEDIELDYYVCGEDHRDVSHIPVVGGSGLAP